jgi:hypothetical protein
MGYVRHLKSKCYLKKTAHVHDSEHYISKLKKWANGSRKKNPFNDESCLPGTNSYKILFEECRKNNIDCNFCGKYKWVMIPHDEKHLYDIEEYTLCQKCRVTYTDAFAVHVSEEDEDTCGEYECNHCKKDIIVRYICKWCKKQNKF